MANGHRLGYWLTLISLVFWPENSCHLQNQLRHKYEWHEMFTGDRMEKQLKGWSFKFRTAKGIT